MGEKSKISARRNSHATTTPGDNILFGNDDLNWRKASNYLLTSPPSLPVRQPASRKTHATPAPKNTYLISTQPTPIQFSQFKYSTATTTTTGKYIKIQKARAIQFQAWRHRHGGNLSATFKQIQYKKNDGYEIRRYFSRTFQQNKRFFFNVP